MRAKMTRDTKSQPDRDLRLTTRSATDGQTLTWTLACADCGTAWTITRVDITAGDGWASCPRCHRRMMLKEIGSSMLGGAGRESL